MKASRYEDEFMYKVNEPRSGVYEIATAILVKKNQPRFPAKSLSFRKGANLRGLSVCLAHGVGVLGYVKERNKNCPSVATAQDIPEKNVSCSF